MNPLTVRSSPTCVRTNANSYDTTRFVYRTYPSPFRSALQGADGIEHPVQPALDGALALLFRGDHSRAAYPLRLDVGRCAAGGYPRGERPAGDDSGAAHEHVLPAQRPDSAARRERGVAVAGLVPRRDDSAQMRCGMAGELLHGTYPHGRTARPQAAVIRQDTLPADGLFHGGTARRYPLAYDERRQ